MLRPAPDVTLTVAHVIHSLGAGGAEAVLVELARAARPSGMRLVVIGLSDAHTGDSVDHRVVPQLRELGASVYEMHAGRYDPRLALTVSRILRDEGVDVVHTHLKHADVVGGAAARLAGLPSVSTLHVIDIPTSRAHQLRVEAAVVARRRMSSTVIALSSAQRAWYSRYAGTAAPVTLLPNGVVEPTITRDRESVRAELGVPEGTLLAGCVSLMRPEKGHAVLLEAIRELPADLPLVVALAGDGPLLEEIRCRVEAEPRLNDRVRVLGFRRDVADLLSASDLVIQPSLEDALPTALISALAAGRPIVATDVGGIPDIVGPGCGQLVDSGDPAALAAGIAAMVETIRHDPATLESMRRATRARYESTFSADIWVAHLVSVYRSAMTKEPAQTRTLTSPPRRIALVEFPPSGGLYQFSLQLGEALARAGDRVELVTGPSPELGSREPGCTVTSILPTWHPTAGADAPEWWRRARRGVRAGQHTAAWGVLIAHLRRTRPDVVIWSAWRFPVDGWGVHAVRKLLPDATLALIAHEPRPLVEQPGDGGMYKSSTTTDKALAAAYADLDVAFVLGESAKKVLLESWPITAPVHVIPHGDEGIFSAAGLPSAIESGPIALSFGTITAYKGIDTLCEAWPAVRAAVPDAQLVIAGAVSADVDEQALRATVDRVPGVTLRTGYVPVEEVAAHFAQARCVVLPYRRSSQSGVAHLAYTFARAVVATDVGDIPTVVRHEVSGLIVPPMDPPALAGALVRLLTDAGTAERMGTAGAAALASGSSWDEVSERLSVGLSGAGHHALP